MSANVFPLVGCSGFLPWGAAIASNHRTGFVNLNVACLFGDVGDNTHRSSRKLYKAYPERVTKYLVEVLGKFQRRNIFTSMTKLTKRSRQAGTWTPRMQKKYDNIDKEATEIMLKAESNCVPTFTFTTPWSAPLIRSSNEIKYWTLRLSMENGRKVAPLVLESVRASAEIKDYTSTREHAIVERNPA